QLTPPRLDPVHPLHKPVVRSCQALTASELGPQPISVHHSTPQPHANRLVADLLPNAPGFADLVRMGPDQRIDFRISGGYPRRPKHFRARPAERPPGPPQGIEPPPPRPRRPPTVQCALR